MNKHCFSRLAFIQKSTRLASGLVAFVFVSISLALTAEAQRLPIGFEHADRNSDGVLSRVELIRYLSDRLQMDGAPYGKVFDELDEDHDRQISKAEFDKRHSAIERVLGPIDAPPADPGVGYKPYPGPGLPLDDVKTFGALFARYKEMVEDEEGWKSSGWDKVSLSDVPKSIDLTGTLPKDSSATDRSLERVIEATAIVVGGGSADMVFSAGAIIISPDGLALTNFHVAEAFNDKLMVLLADGRVVRVTKFLAGDRMADIALVQLEGKNFPWVPIATSAPKVSEDLILMHHSENRFFSYDRGYVKRHIVAKGTPWMEIDGDYGPGGSGCGIFNRSHELIGLVSLIMAGPGYEIFREELMYPDETGESGMPDSDEDGNMDDLPMEEQPLVMGVRVIRVAVPWIAIDKIKGASK